MFHSRIHRLFHGLFTVYFVLFTYRRFQFPFWLKDASAEERHCTTALSAHCALQQRRYMEEYIYNFECSTWPHSGFPIQGAFSNPGISRLESANPRLGVSKKTANLLFSQRFLQPVFLGVKWSLQLWSALLRLLNRSRVSTLDTLRRIPSYSTTVCLFTVPCYSMLCHAIAWDGIAIVWCLSVCLSVRLRRWWIVITYVELGGILLHGYLAQCLRSPYAKFQLREHF